MKVKKIIIAMPTEEEFMPSISRWGHEHNWAKCEAHFVHVVRKDFAISEMNAVQVPDNKTFEQIKTSSLEFFKNKAREIMPERAFENAHFEVLFDTSPAEKIAEYAQKIQANMVVIATRNRKGIVGFFSSSFADRILELSPCDVLVLRPGQDNQR
jgi:nucleotide-binding universal stress UspA family protein